MTVSLDSPSVLNFTKATIVSTEKLVVKASMPEVILRLRSYLKLCSSRSLRVCCAA